MRRANIRQIEQQSEEVNKLSEKEIDDFIKKNSEPKTFKRNSKEYKEETLSNDLTFEEMVSINKKNQEKQKNTKDKKRNAPKPTTFDSRNGYDYKTTYGSDDSGFGFEINVTTDMNLP